MGMNGITAQAELIRAIEEIANRKDGSLPAAFSINIEQMTQDETISPDSSSWNEDATEITAGLASSPRVSENSMPGIEIAKLRRTSVQRVNLNDLFDGYADPNGKRSSRRHDIQLAVVVYSSKRSFRTSTINISYGGVRLKEGMPYQFAKGEIEILVIAENKTTREKEYFLLTGRALSRGRVRFTSASVKAKTALEQLLQSLAAEDAA